MTTVIVPAKPLESALSRLSGVLDGPARTAIQQAMLIDVLCAAGDLTGTVMVVTSDPTVAALATAYGAEVVREPSADGIDAAVAQGIAAAGAGRVLIVMGDLPLATGADLAELASSAPRVGVAIARSADGTGTNAMVLTPPSAIPTAFGPGSLERHRAAAMRAGVACVERVIGGLALDVDTPRDLTDLITQGSDSHTIRICEALDLRDRLAAEAAG